MVDNKVFVLMVIVGMVFLFMVEKIEDNLDIIWSFFKFVYCMVIYVELLIV